MLCTSMLAASVRPFSVVGILFLCFYVHDYCVEIVSMYSMYVVLCMLWYRLFYVRHK